MKANKKIFVLFWFLSLLFPIGCGNKAAVPLRPVEGPGPSTKNQGYQFVLVDRRWASQPFVIDLPLSNVEGVKSFEHYLNDGQVRIDPDGNPAVGILSGIVVKCPPSEHHAWSFCLDPATVSAADMTTEVCDGDFSYVESHLDEWMASVKNYCPWATAGLIQSIKKGDVLLYRRSVGR